MSILSAILTSKVVATAVEGSVQAVFKYALLLLAVIILQRGLSLWLEISFSKMLSQALHKCKILLYKGFLSQPQSQQWNGAHTYAGYGIGQHSSNRKELYEDEGRKYKNHLNQEFDVSKPNEVWVSDVTYFKYGENAYYICAIIDLFSRMVVGYKNRIDQQHAARKINFSACL